MCSHFLLRLLSQGQLLCSSWAVVKGLSGIWELAAYRCLCPCVRKPGRREALPACSSIPTCPRSQRGPSVSPIPVPRAQVWRVSERLPPRVPTHGGWLPSRLLVSGWGLWSLDSPSWNLDFFLIFTIYLAVPGLSCSMRDP